MKALLVLVMVIGLNGLVFVWRPRFRGAVWVLVPAVASLTCSCQAAAVIITTQALKPVTLCFTAVSESMLLCNNTFEEVK